MWIYETKTGLRVTATIEDAKVMVGDDGGRTHSCLSPRGTDEQEAAELARLVAADEALIPEKAEEPAAEAASEVHLRRRHTSSRDPE